MDMKFIFMDNVGTTLTSYKISEISQCTAWKLFIT